MMIIPVPGARKFNNQRVEEEEKWGGITVPRFKFHPMQELDRWN
jgi:hypothetical protein